MSGDAIHTIPRNRDSRSNMSQQTTSSQMAKPMTPGEAAAYLGLDVKTIGRWARQGYLPAHPLGEGKKKYWRFLESELRDWLASKSNRSAA
jgi:excisionase family DNA binding protein